MPVSSLQPPMLIIIMHCPNELSSSHEDQDGNRIIHEVDTLLPLYFDTKYVGLKRTQYNLDIFIPIPGQGKWIPTVMGGGWYAVVCHPLLF